MFGNVASCTVSLRRASHRVGGSEGGGSLWAYIAFNSHKDAAAAVQQLNGAKLHGRSLRVMPRLAPGSAGHSLQSGAGGLPPARASVGHCVKVWVS